MTLLYSSFILRLVEMIEIVTDHTQPCRVRTAPSSFLHDVPVCGIAQLVGSSLDSFSGRVLIGSKSGTGDYHFNTE
jgi:hypothetical protein